MRLNGRYGYFQDIVEPDRSILGFPLNRLCNRCALARGEHVGRDKSCPVSPEGTALGLFDGQQLKRRQVIAWHVERKRKAALVAVNG